MGAKPLFNHIYVWPKVHEMVKGLITQCLGPPTINHPRMAYWVEVGTYRARIEKENELLSNLYIRLYVNPFRDYPVDTGNSITPHFTKSEISRHRHFNIYTPTGLIHDTRWEIPFERPTAPLTVVNAGPHCLVGSRSRKLLNKEFFESQCNAALSLIPRSKRNIDLQHMATDGLNPGSETLIGKEPQTNGDKIRLPAVFLSESCLIKITTAFGLGIKDGRFGQERSNQALFNGIYLWPNVHKQGKNMIKACLGTPSFGDNWSEIGYSRTKLYIENELPAGFKLEMFVRPWRSANSGKSNNSLFTADQVNMFTFCNIHTSAGLIHDPRWKIPFQRDSGTTSVTATEAGTICSTGNFKLINKEYLESQCNTALSLVPTSKRDINMQNMATGSLNPSSETLVSKDHQINGDNICLPAAFVSDYCLVQVFPLYGWGLGGHNGRKAENQVLFNDIHIWPKVHEQGRN